MPTPSGFLLTAAQIKTIERFLYYAQRTNKSRPWGQLGDDAVDHEEFPTPEVYVCRTPPEGIPGFDSYTDSSVGTGAYPYSAECYVHILHPSHGHMENQQFTQLVYNLSPVSIEGNKWVIALRDKFGAWYAIDLSPASSSGFPARTTAGYEVTTGYPWERTILNEDGTFSSHPSGQQGQYAYSPDENQELPTGTNGWLFPNPDSIGTGTSTGTSTAHTEAYDTWIFIPVYRTRTTCDVDTDTIAHQISTDGGETWVTVEDLGVACTPTTGTGTTNPPEPTANCTSLVKLKETDCITATGPSNSVILEPNGEGSWVTIGTGEGDLLEYLDKEGDLEFFYLDGRVRLILDGLELIHCGGDCWTGGPLTGHVRDGTDTTAACEGETFTVCLECSACPLYWYCVATEGTCSGTGTTVIEVLELTRAEAAELGDAICDGPFDTEAEALAVCDTDVACTLSGLFITMSTAVCGIQFNNNAMTSGPNGSHSMSETAGGGFGPGSTDTDKGYGVIVECNDNDTYNILPYTPDYVDGTAPASHYSGPPATYGIVPLNATPGSFHLQLVYTHTDTDCSESPVSVTIDIKDFT